MTTREMHYDLKQKLNKLDSQKNRNLLVPEIDARLNEAQEIFVKVIAEPRYKSQLGFEINQRTIDDLRTIVINQTPEQSNCNSTPYQFDDKSFISVLPEDYWFYIKGRAFATKGTCTNRKIKLIETQHDDETEESPFNRSSFEWKESNIRFVKQGLRVYTDGSYIINKVCLDYIKTLSYIHNAQDYEPSSDTSNDGSYETLEGITLTGFRNSELPSTVHREIVDLAVYLISMDIPLPEMGIKGAKVKFTQG